MELFLIIALYPKNATFAREEGRKKEQHLKKRCRSGKQADKRTDQQNKTAFKRGLNTGPKFR